MSTVNIMNLSRSGNKSIKATADNYYVYLIYLYSSILPLPNNYKSVVLIIMAAVGLYTLFRGRVAITGIFRSSVLISFLLLYCLYILSFLYSNNKAEAADFLVLSISIPLLPFLWYKRLESEQVKVATVLFSISIFFVSLFAIYKTYTVYFNSFSLTIANLKELDWAYFSFSLPISVDFHAPYFSLYMCAGLLIIVHEFTAAIKRRKPTQIVVYSLATLYFLIFIALLSSRTALFATVGVVTSMAIVYMLLHKKVFITTVIILSTAAFLLTAYSSVPYLRAKVSSSAGLSERFGLWNAALDIIEKHPVFGVGTGDRKEFLIAQYKANKVESGVVNNLNPHNQYLDIAVSMGIVGLLTLIACFASVTHHALVKFNPVLLAFILVFGLCCLTESLLHRQAGVVLFSYFCAIFVFSNKASLEH